MGPIDANTLGLLEIVGVAALALSGAFAAAGRGLDLAVVCVAAVAAGLAGGSLRDLLVGAPVEWLDQPAQPASCLVAAGAAWALGVRRWQARALPWLDAVGLGAVAAVGTARAASVGASPLAAAAVGVLAAGIGGLARDGLVRASPMMLGRELYLAAPMAGALLFVALRLVSVGAALAALAAAALAFGLRAGALRFGWKLPGAAERD